LGLTWICPLVAVVTKVGIDATAKPFRKDMPPVAKDLIIVEPHQPTLMILKVHFKWSPVAKDLYLNVH
jgi:hypothetical protein